MQDNSFLYLFHAWAGFWGGQMWRRVGVSCSERRRHFFRASPAASKVCVEQNFQNG